jgi:high-affinity iron transporter
MGVARLRFGAVPAWLLLAVLWPALGRAGVDDPRAIADVRRALTLLNVVAEEYREGVVDGRVALPVEYGESQAFLDEAQARLRGASPSAADATASTFAAVRRALSERAPLDQVRAGLTALHAAITQSTGVAEEIYPPAAPSAARGRALFADNCVPCHGELANGAGPNAAKLDPRPANFTDAEFMRRETPFSFFNIITAGKGTSAMPAWADAFSLQDRWDLVSYLYTVRPGHAGLAEGQSVYQSNCAGCHGAAADGQGQDAPTLAAPVPPLNVPAVLAEKTDDDLVAAVAHGIAGTSMPAFDGRLSEPQMRAAAAYVRLLSLGGDDGSGVVAAASDSPRRFAGLLRVLGDGYRRAVPVAAPIDEHELTASDILLDQVLQQAPRVRDTLAERDAAAATAMSAQLAQLADAVRARRPAAAVAALAEPIALVIEARFPAAGSTQASADDDLLEARRLLGQALDAYRAGNPRAAYMVSDAYFLFDPLEKTLALNDAGLARRAEARFAELRGVMSAPGHDREATALVSAIDADLAAARAALAPRQVGFGLAVQSGLIILREGFEVVLIVGALLAYVRKANAPAMRRPILYGTALGGVASLLTAYVLAALLEASGATGDVLEGTTMLLAAAVLFFVSYWLISKAEADRWQRYIQGKVKSALATGNAVALGGAAFLAVYREGTETILFYKALIDSAPGAFTPVAIGVAGGAAALALVYALYTRLGTRLPMRQFFLATGGLLYYLAVVFAGKGVAELQGAGWVSTTPMPWVPRVDVLGLYPTVETLAAQGALLLCALYALIVTVRRARREEANAAMAMKVASPGSAKL